MVFQARSQAWGASWHVPPQELPECHGHLPILWLSSLAVALTNRSSQSSAVAAQGADLQADFDAQGKGKHVRSHLNGVSGRRQPRSVCRWKDVLRGTMDEVSSLGFLYRSHRPDQNARQIGPPHSTDPMLGGPGQRIPKKSKDPRKISDAGEAGSSKVLDPTRRIEKNPL